MTEGNVLGRNVKRLREAAGMSQADLARRMSERSLAGFYPQTITKIESGGRDLKSKEGVLHV